MIAPDALTEMIQAELADAQVKIVDRTGTMDHYTVHVVSEAFADKNPLDRRRLMHKVLHAPLADGRIHAMDLKTQTPAEAAAG
ncbi:MAG: BolA family transcriptional regulator [Nitrospirota bacterium]|nr:BolA family transcriptional regulator [Nitrospirota bacterium]